jgi:hypothetical protein
MSPRPNGGMSRPVIVGYDASAAAIDALEYAATLPLVACGTNRSGLRSALRGRSEKRGASRSVPV